MKNPFEFEPVATARLWKGRYSRIPGKEPVFHVDTKSQVTVQWYDKQAGENLTARMVNSAATTALGKALNRSKSAHAGWAGGSFAISEFGKVICPIQQSLDRYCVGTVSGIPEFEDPRRPGTEFTLMPDRNLRIGSPWQLPYLGMKFNLSAGDRIYFKQDDHEGTRKLQPPTQDQELIRKLRQLRPGGNVVRFIVNLHGAVFTKVEPHWTAVFVGFINPKRWFADEE